MEPPNTQDINKKHTRWQFQTYMELVQMYTTKELSLSSDILAAFSGVLGWLGLSAYRQILQGLPPNPLDLALLWNSTADPKRRNTSPNNLDIAFPSWFWVGWDNAIDFRLIEQDERVFPTCEVGSFKVSFEGK